MASKLVAEEGLLKELVLSFEEGNDWIIGRDPDACQLLLEDPSVSRKAAIAHATPEGIVLENLSNTNPVLINEEQTLKPKLLHPGDAVKIGNTLFRFYKDTDEHLLEDESQTPVLTPVMVDFPEEKFPFVDEDADTIFEDALNDHQGIAEVNFGSLETGRYLLKVINGPNNGAEFSMQTSNSYTIGTDPNSCDIVFYDISVSRQHARIEITSEDQIFIEDLKSRNGTRVDGEIINNKIPLNANTVVSLGTTSFVIYDREGEMQTIISPLLPSIVKVLQKEDAPKETEKSKELEPPVIQVPETPAKKSHATATFIITAILIGLFVIVGIGVQSLFVQEPIVVKQEAHPEEVLQNIFATFPSVKYSFNKSTGRLLLVGHVLTVSDRSQLLYNLQGLNFIKDIDDSGVIIDEYVWNEANQVLSKNPNWKGVTVHSPVPGKYVLSGYLDSRNQAEQVWDYITRNFPYLDLLENKIVVEEDVVNSINNSLRVQGFNAVKGKMSNGELVLQGSISLGQKEAYDKLLAQFKEFPGIRSITNLVAEKAPNEAVVNISDRYAVTGTSKTEEGKINVVINGRILSMGDALDGMIVTNIQPNYVLLSKDNVIYRIDINK